MATYCDPGRFIRVVKEIGGCELAGGAINLIHHPDEPGGVWCAFSSRAVATNLFHRLGKRGGVRLEVASSVVDFLTKITNGTLNEQPSYG